MSTPLPMAASRSIRKNWPTHAIDCLDELHRQIQEAGFRIAAVAGSAFWHSFCGVDAAGKPTLPILHLLDTRSAAEVLARAGYACLHRLPAAFQLSGPPSCFGWKRIAARSSVDRALSQLSRISVRETVRRSALSTSMASATGLWNQGGNTYDYATLAGSAHPSRAARRPPSMDQPLHQSARRIPQHVAGLLRIALVSGHRRRSGESHRQRLPAAGAIFANGRHHRCNARSARSPGNIPTGLWCYRLDPKRALMGGAFSNGGDVYAWLKRTLAIPKDVEARLEAAEPGNHGLTFLPFLAGERSPYWRADLRGVITGLTLSTDPFQILHASLESISLRFREIYIALSSAMGAPDAIEVIASGGALLHSPAWTQIMADTLGRPVVASTELEASAAARRCTLWSVSARIPYLDALPASTGATFTPRPQFEPEIYARLLVRERALFGKLF